MYPRSALPSSLLRASLVVWLLASAPARAQAPPSAIQALEEEINLLKETLETNNKEIRTLRERLKNVEAESARRLAVIKELQRRLQRVDELVGQISSLEARLTERLSKIQEKSRGKIRVTGEVRVRPEVSTNRTDLDSAKDDNDVAWTHRLRLGLDMGWGTWVRSRLRVQEARAFGTSSPDAGQVSFHEGWLELSVPNYPAVYLRGGRMELSFGSEHLVGRDEFSRAGRAFDGVLLGAGYKQWIEAQIFYTLIRRGTEQQGDHHFFGAYLSTKAIPKTVLDVFFMGTDDKLVRQSGTAPDDTLRTRFYTFGARIESFFYGVRLEAEAVFQLGKRANPDRTDPANLSLEHFATAYFVEASYQIPVTTRPTFGVFFAWASGDANPKDTKSVDFQPLFPTRHAFLGHQDLFSWSNIMDIGGSFDLTPPKNLGIQTAVHYFALADKHGELSGLGGGRTPATAVGRNVGVEVDLSLSWAPSEHFDLLVGYSLFLPMTVPERLGLGTDIAHWAFVQATGRY